MQRLMHIVSTVSCVYSVSSADFLVLLGRALVALGVVCIMMFCMGWIIKKYMHGLRNQKSRNAVMSIRSVFYLEPRKKLIIMKIGNRYHLLAVTETGIQLLRVLPAQEIEDSLAALEGNGNNKQNVILSFVAALVQRKKR
jgi:flagellar biogenesis protein FliO